MKCNIGISALLRAILVMVILVQFSCDMDKTKERVRKFQELGGKVNRAVDRVDSVTTKISEHATKAAHMLEEGYYDSTGRPLQPLQLPDSTGVR